MSRNFSNLIASLFVILISFFSSTILYGQKDDIETIMQKCAAMLQNSRSLKFNLIRRIKVLNKTDTTTVFGKVQLRKINDDTIGKAKFFVEYFDSKTNLTEVQTFCDGRKYLSLDFNKKVGYFMDFNLMSPEYLKQNMDPDFIPAIYFCDHNEITYILHAYKSDKENMRGNSLIDSDSIYEIKIPIKDDSSGVLPTYNAFLEFFIRKSDCFPVRYITYTETKSLGERQSQLFDYELSNIEINPEIPDSTFDIPVLYEKFAQQFKTEDYVSPIHNFLDSMSFAPDFQLAIATGDSISLSSLKGKVVLVDFWYRACYGCLKAIPDLEKLLGDFEDRDLFILGVNVHEEETKFINKYKEKFNIKYTICVNGDRVAKDYLASAYPTFYLIDKKGRIRFSQAGWTEGLYESLRDKIKILLVE